ncbi:hypothetical protein HZH66_001320 [Vespula vulgaris]|uniref:Uncharacterized protein n=1 Tax=Vespula vulgaris TaxID=7454 RepID=A0A834KWB1_VESVU|nr:hypothetical protein HZH66_001320 [Vespula vulgaris]
MLEKRICLCIAKPICRKYNGISVHGSYPPLPVSSSTSLPSSRLIFRPQHPVDIERIKRKKKKEKERQKDKAKEEEEEEEEEEHEEDDKKMNEKGKIKKASRVLDDRSR